MSKHINDKLLDFWIENNLNVLFSGKHGVGKTTIVKDAFERHHLRSIYFSAATMDPWIDFVGVPREVKDEKDVPYLDLVRPKAFRDDQVEAIFIDEFNRCLTGDTKIPLLDGHNVPIRDLIGKSHFYVYSFNHSTNKIVVGKGHSARLTEKQAKIIKVTLDNGTFIKCTVDHPFLMFDGSYKRADRLSPGNSLMPFYRLSECNRKNMNGYERVFQPKSNGKWDWTYHMADDFNINNNIYGKDVGEHRHHINFCKSKALANSINTRRTSLDYKELRSKISKEIYTPEMREHRSEVTKEQWKNGQFDTFDRTISLHQNHLMRCYNLIIKIDGFDVQNILTLSETQYETLRERVSTQGYALLKLSTINKNYGSFEDFKRKILDIHLLKSNGNHRVISIEDAGHEDVYDITVNNYHNFALECGAFVHNSHKKVRNAVMELIQFKSINGKRFNNLRMVWAAQNPDDGNYDTEKLDPAQKDRFHVHITLPYILNRQYFSAKFGAEITEAAAEWWGKLPEDIKDTVSPRRLDMALEILNKGGDLRFVLPEKSNISKLTSLLERGSIIRQFEEIFDAKDLDKMHTFLQNENLYSHVEEIIVNKFDKAKFCVPLLSPEKQMVIASKNEKFREFIPQKLQDQIESINLPNCPFPKNKSNSATIDRFVASFQISNFGKKEVEIPEIQNQYDANHLFISLKTTLDRRKTLNIFWNIPSNINVTDAWTILWILDKIVASSQIPSLNKVANKYCYILNQIVRRFNAEYGKVPMRTFAEEAPNVCKKLIPILIGKDEEFCFERKN